MKNEQMTEGEKITEMLDRGFNLEQIKDATDCWTLYREFEVAEKIIRMLCDSFTVKAIEAQLGMAHSQLENAFESVRRKACLPREKVTYKARKEDILSNIALYKAHALRLEKIENEYLNSLTKF